jgi:hypothetical protein
VAYRRVVNDGILSEPLDVNAARHARPSYPAVEAKMGVVVEYRATGVVGAIVSFKPQQVVLRDRHGRDHAIAPRDGAFMIDGKPISLRQPAPVAQNESLQFTASGSVDVGKVPARIARPSRIWVEGMHDAELIEKVWGEDLRIEGVVVEQLEGMDDLADRVARFQPRPGRRLGILLDHLVEGSKESREAAVINHPDVLITGHPYVDVWQAIKPESLGIAAWPTIPMGTDWKSGIMESFGFHGHPGAFWKQLLGQANSFRDLEQPMVGAVEQLIDFVTVEGPH